jgi:AmiR/NasT family two-component response regulator
LLVERATGILQDRFAWTEEEAYLRLRRTSHRASEVLSELRSRLTK